MVRFIDCDESRIGKVLPKVEVCRQAGDSGAHDYDSHNVDWGWWEEIKIEARARLV